MILIAIIGYIVGIFTTLLVLAFCYGARKMNRKHDVEVHIMNLRDLIHSFDTVLLTIECGETRKLFSGQREALVFAIECIEDMNYEGREKND